MKFDDLVTLVADTLKQAKAEPWWVTEHPEAHAAAAKKAKGVEVYSTNLAIGLCRIEAPKGRMTIQMDASEIVHPAGALRLAADLQRAADYLATYKAALLPK